MVINQPAKWTRPEYAYKEITAQRTRVDQGNAFCLLVLQTLLTFWHLVAIGNARPEGAPFSACRTMVPIHGSNTAREDLSPYVVLVSQASYRPGDSVSVMLRGLCSIEFMGFLAEARRADPVDPRYIKDPDEAVGSFSAVMGTRYECGDNRNALTHNMRYNGTTLLFNWTAPSEPQGHVQIKASFVQRFDSFWPQVASVVIQDPTADALSVNPDDLRTPFITPCEIDRPTTPSSEITTPSPGGILSTSGQRQLTPPMFSTTTPRLTSVTRGVVQPPNWSGNPRSELVPLGKDPACGVDRGCFLNCKDGVCDFTVMWSDIGDYIWFDVKARQVTSRADQYVAVAFSDDTKMGSDSVVECTEDDGKPRVHVSYNKRFRNDRLKELDNEVFANAQMAVRDGLVRCQFARKKDRPGDRRVYDLDKDWYMLVAQGTATDGTKAEHNGLPSISSKIVDFQSNMVVYPLISDRMYIKTHACLMILAWLFCASIGTVVARFYKPLWPHKTFCGRKVWFTIHRMCMVAAGCLNLVSFALIFYEVQGMSDISILRFRKLHPVVGIVTTFIVVVQIILGIFRPHSSSENRPVFNWGHWLLGIITHILTVFNMMLGVGLKKASVHVSVVYILYAYAVYQVIIVIILEIIFCNIRVKVRKQQSYSIYEIRNAIYSSTKDILDSTVSEPPGAFLLRIILGVHILIITSFAAAIIAVIIFIDVY